MPQNTTDESESRGCALIVVGVILIAIYSMTVLMGSLVPSAAVLWNSRDYKAATFLVQRTTYIPAQKEGRLRSPASWMAVGTIEEKKERLDLEHDIPQPTSSGDLDRQFPIGKNLQVLINPKLSPTDPLEWPQRVILDRPDWFRQRVFSFLFALAKLALPWIIVLALGRYKNQSKA